MQVGSTHGHSQTATSGSNQNKGRQHSAAASSTLSPRLQASIVKGVAGQGKQLSRKKRVSFVDDMPATSEIIQLPSVALQISSAELPDLEHSAASAVKAASPAAVDSSDQGATALELIAGGSCQQEPSAKTSSPQAHCSTSARRVHQQGPSAMQPALSPAPADAQSSTTPRLAASDSAASQSADAKDACSLPCTLQHSRAAPMLLPRFSDTWQEYKRAVQASTDTDTDRSTTPLQVRYLGACVGDCGLCSWVV